MGVKGKGVRGGGGCGGRRGDDRKRTVELNFISL